MTWLTVKEYLCHKWSCVCSVVVVTIRSFPHSWHPRACNKNDTTGATCGAGTAYPSQHPSYPGFLVGFVKLPLTFRTCRRRAGVLKRSRSCSLLIQCEVVIALIKEDDDTQSYTIMYLLGYKYDTWSRWMRCLFCRYHFMHSFVKQYASTTVQWFGIELF